MKILYITPNEPSLRYGGGRHCYANVRALSLYPGAIVDYIGPKINEELPDLSSIIFNKSLARPFTYLDKIKAAFLGASTSLVSLLNEFRRDNIKADYDLMFVESTRCGFVFREIGSKTRVICCVHNVEADYMKFNGIWGTRLASMNIRKSEQLTLNSCQILLVMHNDDQRRLREIYHINDKTTSFMNHPVCSPSPKIILIPYEERDKQFIFVGSLDEKFNEMGLREFLFSCWPEIKNAGYSLIVAGRNPSKALSKFILLQTGVRLIANPLEMSSLLRNSRILLLPDITGTGMKLRVAEAMSLGVPVVGTHAGLRGYEEINRFGEEVETVYDMKNAIFSLLADPSHLASCAKAAQEIWKERYSIDIFTARLHRIIDNLFVGSGVK